MKTTYNLFFLLLCLLASTPSVFGQSCSDYPCKIRKAKTAIEKKDYQTALDALDAADGHDDKNIAEIKQVRQRLFDAIEKDRKEAIEARNKFEKQLERNKKLISYFGFNKKTNRSWAYRDGKFAIIDAEGNLITAKDSLGKKLGDFVFDVPLPFNDRGFAIVQKDGFYHVVNSQGIISDPFNYFLPCNNGWFKVKKGDLYSFLDKNGKPTACEWFEKINNFNLNLAFFKEEGYYGIMNAEGYRVYPSEFGKPKAKKTFSDFTTLNSRSNSTTQDAFPNFENDTYSDESYDLITDKMWVNVNGEWGLLNKNLTFDIEPTFDEIPKEMLWDASDLYLIKKNNLYGFMSLDSKIFVEPRFESPPSSYDNRQTAVFQPVVMKIKSVKDSSKKNQFGRYNDGDYYYYQTEYLITTSKKKMGVIDTFGHSIVEFEYDQVEHLSDNFLKVKKGEFYGIIALKNKKVDIILPCNYSAISQKEGNIYTIELNGKRGFINLNSLKKLQPQFDISTRNFGDYDDDYYDYYNYDNLKKGILPIRKQGLKGLIDTNFNILVPPKFEDTYSINGSILTKSNNKWRLFNPKFKTLGESVAFDSIVKTRYSDTEYTTVFNNNKCGLIDSLGNILIPTNYDSIVLNIGNDNYAWVIKKEKVGLYSIVSKKELIQPRFEVQHLKRSNGYDFWRYGLYNFSGNFSWVIENNEYLIIDTLGNKKIAFTALQGYDTDDKRYHFEDDGVQGFIDSTGYIFRDDKRNFDKIYQFQEGLALFEKNGKKGWIDKNGKIKIQAKFDDALQFRHGIAKVTYQDKIGWLKLDGKYHIEPIYQKVLSDKTEDDTVAVKINNMWGWLNYRTQKYLIQPQFKEIYPYERDSLFTVVNADGKYGFVNINSPKPVIINPFYDEIESPESKIEYYLQGRYLLLRKDNKIGLCDYNGNILFPLSTNDIEIFDVDKKMAINKVNGKKGLINSQGKQLIPAQFDKLPYYNDSIVIINQGDNYGLYDIAKNKITVPIQYKSILYEEEGNYWKATKTISEKDEVFHIDSNGLIIVSNPNEPIIKPNPTLESKPKIKFIPPKVKED